MANQYHRVCPNCGASDHIVVSALLSVPILLGKEGVGDTFYGRAVAIAPDDANWEPGSDCWCARCQWNGCYKELGIDE